jgi:hypothetical protein
VVNTLRVLGSREVEFGNIAVDFDGRISRDVGNGKGGLRLCGEALRRDKVCVRRGCEDLCWRGESGPALCGKGKFTDDVDDAVVVSSSISVPENDKELLELMKAASSSV